MRKEYMSRETNGTDNASYLIIANTTKARFFYRVVYQLEQALGQKAFLQTFDDTYITAEFTLGSEYITEARAEFDRLYRVCKRQARKEVVR